MHPAAGPGLFPLHLWEDCMSGISKTDQPHGYEQVHSAGFTFSFSFNVVGRVYGRDVLIERGMPLMMETQLRKDSFLSTQTGIECQQDMLGDDDKRYTRASGMLYCNLRACAEGGRSVDGQRSGGRGDRRTSVASLLSQQGGLLVCLRTEQTRAGARWRGWPGTGRILEHRDCRLISYSSGLCLGRSAPRRGEWDAGRKQASL